MQQPFSVAARTMARAWFPDKAVNVGAGMVSVSGFVIQCGTTGTILFHGFGPDAPELARIDHTAAQDMRLGALADMLDNVEWRITQDPE